MEKYHYGVRLGVEETPHNVGQGFLGRKFSRWCKQVTVETEGLVTDKEAQDE